jgi:hypothetical protein
LGASDMGVLLHGREHVGHAERHLNELLQELISECQASGALRDDVAAAELTTFCLHALSAASRLASKAAVDRLVTVTLAGLRTPGRD